MARVLVVDDDPDIRELVRLKLSRLGHDVRVAADGEAGLDACRAQCPDLAIVDVSMPVMSGLELVIALRSAPAFRELPVILLTALAQPADVEAGLAAGASTYMTKPFSPADLANHVRDLLEGEPDLTA